MTRRLNSQILFILMTKSLRLLALFFLVTVGFILVDPTPSSAQLTNQFSKQLPKEFADQLLPPTSGGLVLIGHSSEKSNFTQREVEGLFSGAIDEGKFRLIAQDDSTTTQKEFLKSILKVSSAELQRNWSVLVFAGHRVPTVLHGDAAVYSFVQGHPGSIGYVATHFLREQRSQSVEKDPKSPVVLLTLVMQ